MNHYKSLTRLVFLFLIFSVPFFSKAQISAVDATAVPTEYASGTQDNIYVFCGNRGEQNGRLVAKEPSGATASFEWSKYNPQSGNFDVIRTDNPGSSTSTLEGLGDGGYRVKVTSASGENTYTAWVFNNYIDEVTAEIPESDCNSFLLKGGFVPANFTYADLSNGQTKELYRNTQVEWKQGDTKLSILRDFRNYAPPTKNTEYTFVVSDRFGCKGEANVSYLSVVTKASFDFKIPDQKSDKPENNEAPLTVTFTNTSENGDAGQFEWFFYKDLAQIAKEKASNAFKDSIMDVVYNDSPVYTFEKTGEYIVKLVSKHVSEIGTCTDTFYIPKHIIIGESFLDAPNVFTPNGDSENDKFAVKFFSMKSVKITILNRWGKVVHKWESNNVRGFYNTASEKGENYVAASVWDGKIGGRYASPGVYYYVAEGIGRDGKRRHASGFFHLFRDK